MAVETFNSSTTWTAPAGVTSVQVECWGRAAQPIWPVKGWTQENLDNLKKNR